MNYLKKNLITIFSIMILITIGLLFIVINPVLLIKILMYTIAILMITFAINALVTSEKYVGEDNAKLIIQANYLIVSAIFLFIFPVYTTRLIIGIILLIIPIIELLIAKDKLTQLNKDIWKYIVGIIFVLSFGIILKILFVSLGIAIFVLAGYLIYLLILHKNDNQNIFIIIFLKKIIRKEENDIWRL